MNDFFSYLMESEKRAMRKFVLLFADTGRFTDSCGSHIRQAGQSAKDKGSWLTYSGTYNSERFAPLAEINTDTVKNLKAIWAYQMQPSTG